MTREQRIEQLLEEYAEAIAQLERLKVVGWAEDRDYDKSSNIKQEIVKLLYKGKKK